MRPTIDSIAIGEGKGFKTQKYEKSKSRNSYSKGVSYIVFNKLEIIKENSSCESLDKRSCWCFTIREKNDRFNKSLHKFLKNRLAEQVVIRKHINLPKEEYRIFLF